ncbi:hypothetical protein BC936DRAFT_136569, partial [Jimgerdemannia flammicorona]
MASMGLARLIAGLGFLGPSLEPGHVNGLLQHIVAVPAGDRDERNSGGVEINLLDEIAVSGGVNDGDIVLGGLELPESNVDGDTTLTLSFQFVQNPGVFERRLAKLSSLLLELLDGTLIDTAALVDQVVDLPESTWPMTTTL